MRKRIKNRNLHRHLASLILEVHEADVTFPDTDIELIATYICLREGLHESMVEVLVMGANRHCESNMIDWAKKYVDVGCVL